MYFRKFHFILNVEWKSDTIDKCCTDWSEYHLSIEVQALAVEAQE